MPHGRTRQEIRDYVTQRELLGQYLDEGTSGRHGAGRPRGHDTRGYGDSDRGGPRTTGSRHDYPPNASGVSRGHGGHHAAPGGGGYEDYPDFSDDDSLAGESVDPRAGGARGSHGMGPYGSENPEALLDSIYDSIDSIRSDFRVPGPPHAGSRGQQRGGHGLPHFSRTGGSRYTDTSFDGSTEESTDDDDDDESVYCPGPGVAASDYHGAGSSRRHQELPPHSRRGGMYQGGRSGSVDSEAELGGRNTSSRQYGGQRAPGSYERYGSGRDSDRRRF